MLGSFLTLCWERTSGDGVRKNRDSLPCIVLLPLMSAL